MCLPPKINSEEKNMLNINKQLSQSLRTVNIILFVRLQKRDGMAWISIFKPVPPVCVTERFDPIWKWKLPLRSSRLASSRENTNNGGAWRKPAQTGSVHVFGGGGGGWPGPGAVQVSGLCVCPAGASSRRLRHLFCFMRLFWTQTFTCVSPSCRAPASSARLARLRDLFKRNSFFSSVSSLVSKPVLRGTLTVWPSAHTLLLSAQVRRVLAGNRAPENQINGGDPEKTHKSLRNKFRPKLFQNIIWNIPQNQFTLLLSYLYGLVCVSVCVILLV